MSQITAVKTRVQSIDILRGIIMVIMALDHVRDYFHKTGMTNDPLNLSTTTPALFFTRWITHFCAPIFVFLSGTSIYLVSTRKTKKEVSSFLIKRGLWLVLIEVTLITLGWTFNPFYNAFVLQVIWVIGISMAIMGLLIWLPYNFLLILGLAFVFGHDLIDYAEAAHAGAYSFWWDLLHHGSFAAAHSLDKTHVIVTAYALIPWLGAMILGYCFGKLYSPGVNGSIRQKLLFRLGFCAILLFVIVRWINIYGDPRPWTTQQSFFYTFLDFIKVNKYPPSLMYLCMTIGTGMLMLALLENVKNKTTGFFNVFGRVPFFYYILHLYLIHLICVILFFTSGYTTQQISAPGQFFNFRPNNFGYSLPVVYLIWLIVIFLLYFPCRKYNQYKSTHKHWWLSYL
ncbi:DUF1624 domain-containing protein [Ferruginibacter albus]|uniref:DUF1624 domain-containing protein n=1 Tax=Ferruginibacter albus TaxID=2875540 RepID=UPI001CC45FC8|nr:heparan-alpha-glucosaminide N-acetyltransferase domain-containing protein [Ferruginibacter albus]UAY53543.1 heparan-alpha-glucosaminide N-acetyltransferase domain-containing protein [Ferruginibacter albus]